MFSNKRKDKKKKIRFMAVLVATLLITAPFSASIPANAEAADPGIIHQESNKQTITKGVTLENIVKFTTDGWYNIHVLTVDLANEYIDVDTLTNMESIGKLASTKKLASQRDAVAAINASFFTPDGGGYGHPVGTVVQSSGLMAASGNINYYSNSMASFSLDRLNRVLYDYWKASIRLVSENGAMVDVAQYNMANGNKYTDITVFDKKWGATAIETPENMPDLVQMIVSNGKVSEFLLGEVTAKIPENGFVAVTRTEGAKKLQQIFSPGDSISLEIDTTPDWADIKMSVSGSSLLLVDGSLPDTFSFNPASIANKSPKTAIGSSKNGKLLYLVTVDGRQTASIGLSQKDLALFMKSIGAHNAINLDGGGSTTMVARPSGSTDIQIMNTPSDGLARSVSTAIGVFSSAPAGPLNGIAIETADRFMFTNMTRAFTVKGYDKYNNPAEVNPEDVKWSVTGVRGTFNGNVFSPSTYGEGKITAKVGKYTATLNISVLSRPIELILSHNSIKVPVGDTRSFTVIGVNPRGYRASIEPSDLEWVVEGEMGTMTGGVFTAERRGAGHIEASYEDIHAYCSVAASSPLAVIIDDFETKNGTFLSYPDTVPGSYATSLRQRFSGRRSGRLTYEFAASESTRAAYMVFSGDGLLLEEGTSRMGLQVHNDHENSGWLMAELYDKEGKKQLVDLSKTLDWTGWKYVDASLEHIKMPARLTRIYIAQIYPEADAGTLYFDDLTLIDNGYPSVDISQIPENTIFVDEANIPVSIKSVTEDTYRFAVMGQSRAPANETENNLVEKFADKVTKYLEISAVVGSGSHESITGLISKKPVVATHTVDLKSTKDKDYEYSVTDFKKSRFIKLDTRKNGLRLSDSQQWFKFLDDLESFKGNNVFIFMQGSPESFSDKLEMSLFKETLREYRFNTLRNVWVFFNGGKNESYMENGVRYISTVAYEDPDLAADSIDTAQYVLVTVKGSAVTYVYKPINS